MYTFTHATPQLRASMQLHLCMSSYKLVNDTVEAVNRQCGGVAVRLSTFYSRLSTVYSRLQSLDVTCRFGRRFRNSSRLNSSQNCVSTYRRETGGGLPPTRLAAISWNAILGAVESGAVSESAVKPASDVERLQTTASSKRLPQANDCLKQLRRLLHAQGGDCVVTCSLSRELLRRQSHSRTGNWQLQWCRSPHIQSIYTNDSD